MASALLLLWVLSTIALWACAVWALVVASAQGDPARAASARATALVAAVPPTLELLVSAFVLLQAAPTVQYNAGSPRAMGLWHFWGAAWPVLFACSWLQAGGYLAWSVTFAKRQPRSVRWALGCGVLASAIGAILLSGASPSV